MSLDNNDLVMFGLRLKQARENLKLSQQELAMKVGTSKSMISSYESGGSDPRQSMIPRLSKALKIDISWLMMGLSQTNSVNPKKTSRTSPDPTRARLNKAYNALNTDGQERVADYAEDLHQSGRYEREDEALPFEELQTVYSVAHAAAGAGSYNSDYQEPSAHIVKTEHTPRHDCVIDVCGDSMEPTIHDGDIAFVVHKFDIVNGQVYAINIDDETVIKRCYFERKGLRLVSDNPEWPDRIVREQDNISIAGRVVGWATPENKNQNI